jgi:aminomethyltransferase
VTFARQSGTNLLVIGQSAARLESMLGIALISLAVQYPAGVIEEHMATRTRVGLFDVSHMGEIWVEGPDAISFVNGITTNDVTKLVDGQAHYSAFPNETGGVVDDLLVYRFAEDRLLLVVNAGTTEKDWEWVTAHKGDANVTLRNASAEYCQIAVQGPKAVGILKQLTETALEQIKYYHFTEGKVDGVDAIISRTGYTGEDGFEVYAAAEYAEQLFRDQQEERPYGARHTKADAGGEMYGALAAVRLACTQILAGDRSGSTHQSYRCPRDQGKELGITNRIRRLRLGAVLERADKP